MARLVRAEQLRALLEDVPDLAEVAIRIVVGGDLVTDDVDVEDVKVTGDSAGTRVVLVPADVYDLRDLIDEGLAARADRELAERMLEDRSG